MFRIYSYLLILPVLLLSVNHLQAQEEDILEGDSRDSDPRDGDPRQYLRDKIFFTYIKPVNEYRVEIYPLSKDEIFESDTCDVCNDFLTNNSHGMENARALVRGLFAPPGKGGDLALQRYARDICQLLDIEIDVFLYDDSEIRSNGNKLEEYKPCTDSHGYVWPCAAIFENNEDSVGYMHLGTTNMYIYGLEWTKATFLHELMHTQHPSQLKAHIFHPYTAGQWYIPSLNRSPFVSEAAPSLNTAYQEGIANAILMLYNPAEAERAFTWFANNDYLLIETAYNKENTNIPKKDWLYNCLRDAAGEGDQLPGNQWNASLAEHYRGYRIQELPPRFIMHNEMILALTLYHYAKHVSTDKLITAMHENHALISLDALSDPDNELSPLATLLDFLCAFSLPEGETIRTLKDLPRHVPKPYLLPLAYADFFTRYQTRNKMEFSEIFDDKLPQHWIDLYWEQAKETVRNERDKILPDDLEAIAFALNILVSEDE